MSTPRRSATEAYEKTPTRIFPNSGAAAKELAAEVRKLIDERAKQGKSVVLGMATGSTPVPFYRELIRLHKDEKLSFKNAIGLLEAQLWKGNAEANA